MIWNIKLLNTLICLYFVYYRNFNFYFSDLDLAIE